jgi:plasmid stabilization system protein ParE
VKLSISDRAEREITDAVIYMAANDPRAAEGLLDRLYATFERLAKGELQGPWSRLVDGQRVQSWPVRPYRVYYQRSAEQTIIVRVHHQSRRPIE